MEVATVRGEMSILLLAAKGLRILDLRVVSYIH